MTNTLTTEILVEDRPWTDPEGAHLRCEQRAEIAIRYGTDDSEPGVKPSAADIAVFLVASVDGKPVACGGLRELHGDDALAGDAEIKRMFVRAPNRGHGASIAILRGLEQRALDRGWSRLVLETGNAQPDAKRFYEREGYTRIENFGHYRGNADSVCYGKTLVAS